MTTAITLVDLDDTVFQTLRKCPVDMDPSRLTPYAFGADGQPISYATPSQVAFIAWLEATTYLVVVTARSGDALFRSRVRFRQAVAAHGGLVITSPEQGLAGACPDWHARMHGQLSHYHDPLRDIVAQVERNARGLGIPVRARIVHEGDLPLYVVVKHGSNEGRDHELHHACAAVSDSMAQDWTVHINGNNVAYLPPGLGKQHAVEWLLPKLRAQHPDLPVIGIGDSLTDGPFMQMCDFAMTPTRSQLAGRLFAPGRSAVAPSPVLASSVLASADETL